MTEDEGRLTNRITDRRMSRRELLVIAGRLGLGAAAIGPLLAACGSSGTATPASTETAGTTATPGTTAAASPTATQASVTSPTEREKTLIAAYTDEGVTLDPAIYWQPQLSCIMAGLYENLVTGVWHEEDDSVEVVPQLAESWEISPDNKEFTFKLRKGITFHDGEPYNAEAQKYAFDRALGLNEGPAYMVTDYLDKVEVVDEFTLKLTLKKPIATYMQYISGFWYPSRPISPKAAKDHATADDPWAKAWFTGNAVGTGPYKFDEWVPKQQYVVSKYDNYWRGWDGNHIEKVIHRIIPELATQRLLIEKGDIDAILEPLPPQDAKALEGKPGLVIKKVPSIFIDAIQIHCQKKPTSDINVRRGLIAAFDYDQAIESIYGGLAIRNGTMYPKGMEGFREGMVPKKDLEKAKKYFADAGYASGLTLELIYVEGQDLYRRQAEMFQSDLASIGVTLNVRAVALSTMFEMENAPETGADLVLISWGPDNRDSYSIAYIEWFSGFPPGGVNWSYYKNPRMDEMLSQAQGESDAAKRTKLYEDIDQLARDDAAWLPICQPTEPTVQLESIKGSNPSPTRPWSLIPYDVYRG